ncbi:MAG: endonuclease NucS [Asgard group archaeon]|nr:endonuclease NucS [Asgard group archaeon]
MMKSSNTINNSAKMYFELYYDPQKTPKNLVKEAKELLNKIKKEKNIPYKVIISISKDEASQLKGKMRLASNRGKFRIVSGGGATLPISGGKNLNLSNIPIVLLYSDNKIIDIYPKGIQGVKGSCKSIKMGLQEILQTKAPLSLNIDKLSFSEQDLRNLIITKPELIEEGLKFNGVEVKIPSSIIDLVFEDQEGNHLLLEFKLTAKDKTLGQIARYNLQEYCNLMKIPETKIRRGIVMLHYSGQIIKACKNHQIELYQINLENVGYEYSP